jgi:hypothetical protein
MPDPLEQLGSAIPSLYYDLIARVVPGLTLLGIAYLGTPQRSHVAAAAARFDSAAAILATIILAYVVGILVTPLGSLIFEAPGILAARRRPELKKYASDRLWLIIDTVETKNASVASTLAKMAAEVTLCQNILAGTFVLLLIPTVRHQFSAWMIVLWLTVTVLSTFFRALVLCRRAAAVAAEYGIT